MRDAAGRVKGGLLGGAGLVVLLWAAQVPPSARLDALFATAAHLTGLLAGYGILAMLFLMARVPAVEHGVGADRLARWHALGGRHVLLLCSAHGPSPSSGTPCTGGSTCSPPPGGCSGAPTTPTTRWPRGRC
ncbi:hypothetical protein ACFWBH_08665 [Streptomyces sp. NPDC059999]|uniref:hypothetical protein n=1 Tax=Streptomyces sp. NPDC059999 TaxID=3347030 RepID=UPI0036AC1993